MDVGLENAGYWDASLSVEARVNDLLPRMTVDEKLAQVGSLWAYQVLDGEVLKPDAEALLGQGIGQITRVGGSTGLMPEASARAGQAIQDYLRRETRLGIPAIIHEETCGGYMANGSTIFPQPIGLASTWHPELIRDMGTVIAAQLAAVGAHQALAPVLDVTWDPRWGRTEETFGEDPLLVGAMGVAYVLGIQTPQSRGSAMATGKHFIAYGISEGGLNWAPARVPPREMQEVFLFPFEAAVKVAGLGSIMPAYHDLDGVPCHANRSLIQDTLRRDWDFDGIVVSDYFGVAMVREYHGVSRSREENAALSLAAGVDVELPATNIFGEPLRQALSTGRVDEGLLTETVRRILRVKFRLGLFDRASVAPSAVAAAFSAPAIHDLAERLARESMVLLHNPREVLPLSKEAGMVAVVGPNASSKLHLCGDYSYAAHVHGLRRMEEDPAVMGAPTSAPDAARDELSAVVSVLEGIRQKIGAERVRYAGGCDVVSSDRSGFAEAAQAARDAQVTVAVLGDRSGLTPDCTTGESRDRSTLDLPGQQEALLRELVATGTPVVVVLISGRPVTIPEDLLEKLEGVLEAWLPGQAGGTAVADILFGDYNPSGRLPLSVPYTVGQIPVYYRHKRSGGRSHWHGDYVDGPASPRYPFGFGLSYTQFVYDVPTTDTPVVSAEQGVVHVAVTVANRGHRSGEEVVQLYAAWDSASMARPASQLVGFQRVALPAGEARRVEFSVPIDQMAFLNETMTWVVEDGTISFRVGRSAADLSEAVVVAVEQGGPVTREHFFGTVTVSAAPPLS